MKFLKQLIVVLLVCVAGVIAWGLIRPDMPQATPNTPTGVPSPPVVSPTDPTATSPPDGQETVPPQEPALHSKSAQRAAQAAVTCVGILSTAGFLPREQMVGYVSELADPSITAVLPEAIERGTTALAESMGYASTAEAANNANYYAKPQLYRVQTIDAQTALVSLFVVNHYVAADGKEYLMPNVTDVTLKRSGKDWLYVSSVAAPQQRQPEPAAGLTYDETIARFTPYLKGFDDVQNIVSPSS